MTLRSHPLRAVLGLGLAGALALGTACEQVEKPTETPDAPAGAAKPRPKPKPSKPPVDGLSASQSKLGPLTAVTAPTTEAIGAAMPSRYTVRAAGETARAGATVEVLLGDDVVLQVFPTADGTGIARAYSEHRHVVFPWDTRVGDRIGSHKNWDRMTCTKALAPFEDRATCNAFEEARIVYLIAANPDAPLPGKELLADAPIAGVLWQPDPPGAAAEE